jgi:cytochrome c oxidase subunit 3
VTLLGLTLLGGAGFMGVKVLEYQAKWRHGLLWGRHYAPEAHEPGHAAVDPAPPPARAARDVPAILPPAERSTIPPAAVGPPGTVTEGDPEPSGEEIVPANVHWFFGIYFLMTGLHGIHVLGGMGAIGWLALRASRGHFSDAYFTPVDLVGLYWHLVDMIWIFLFPLLYLIH